MVLLFFHHYSIPFNAVVMVYFTSLLTEFLRPLSKYGDNVKIPE